MSTGPLFLTFAAIASGSVETVHSLASILFVQSAARWFPQAGAWARSESEPSTHKGADRAPFAFATEKRRH